MCRARAGCPGGSGGCGLLRGEAKSPGTYLYAGFERQEGIARVAHFEDATKSVLGKVANLENLQIRRDSAEVKFGNENIVNDDGRLGRFV